MNKSLKISQIKIKDIILDENQPRKEILKKELKELECSIEKNGLIQPIVLRKEKDKFKIVAGERRFRAMRNLGKEYIDAIVRDLKKEDSYKIALIENIQREDLSSIEEALAYTKILNEFEINQEELGKELGKSRSYISNIIRILNLEDSVLKLLNENLISFGHGRALLGIKDMNKQKEMAELIMEKGLTVRETENIIKDLKKPEVKEIDNHILELEDQLMMSLGTKVNLNHGEKKKIIEIEYYNDEDLERILEKLL